MFGFQSGRLDIDHRDVEAQRMAIADRFAGVGWRGEELLAAMWRSPDFYLDSMSQVRMPRWSTGRIALVGDAGYGPSPLSGQGTSLALVGAYVLAGELARAGGDHAVGFDAYQRALAEYVQLNQQLALGPAKRGTTRFANWRASRGGGR
jgi:2-polyprenyl-6-methoxyphenol hydroxylase-like FAD-dependent oxidoreductase